MTDEQIETFLAVYECRNITAAARQLYTTQSTVSHRISLLEDEVGVPLFVRHRGQRSLAATPAGEDFVDIAHRWQALVADTARLASTTHRSPVAIGGNELSGHLFGALYDAFVGRHPEIRLRVRTHHSEEIYRMVENRQVDLGLAYSRLDYPDVIVRPLLCEEMYVVTSAESSYPEAPHANELPAQQEVYLGWSTNYTVWHNRYWRPEAYLMHASTGMQALRFLDVPGRWAIVPWSVYESEGIPRGLVARQLTERPPQRTCYLLAHRRPREGNAAARETLRQELEAYAADLIAAGSCTAP